MNVPNLYALAASVLPPVLRRPGWLAFLKSSSAPLVSLAQGANGVYLLLRYDSLPNGQVCMLEKRLNDELDSDERRIYIDDPVGVSSASVYVFNKSENQPAPTVYNKSEIGDFVTIYNKAEDSAFDFVVFVPQALNVTSILDRLNVIVKRYKIASKRFQIQFV